MQLNVSCNHSWTTLNWRRNASKEINKKLQQQVVFLCAAHQSTLKKNKERINLVHFRNVEEEFRSQNQMTTSHNTRKHFALSHAHFRTDGPKVTVLYIGQNLKSNTFRLGLKNIALSIGLDNGWEEKIIGLCIFLQLFGMACKLPVALNTDMRSLAFRLSFLTSYFIVSKWWPISEWNKSYFFAARKF